MSSPVLAQGTQADYDRAATLDRRTQNKVFRDRVTPHWSEGGAFWYRIVTTPGESEFVFVNPAKAERRSAFDHEKLAKVLGEKIGKPIDARKLPFSSIKIAPDGAWTRFRADGKIWQYDADGLRESQENIAEETLPVERRIRPSRRTGEGAGINFINRTNSDVVLFWSDPDGNLKQYETVKPGAAHRQNTYAGHVWVVKDSAGKLLGVFEAQDDERDALVDGNFTPRNPSGTQPTNAQSPTPAPHPSAFIRDFNVWLRDGDKEIQLTQDGTKENAYERPFYGAPDGAKFVVMQVKPAQEHKVYMVDSSPTDQVQPKLKTIDYLKPGDQIRQARPHLFNVKGRKEIPVDNELFGNPWSLGDVEWDKDSSAFSFLYNQRGHQVMRVISVDADSGVAKAIVEETSRTFIDYSQKSYFNRLGKSGEILWASERDGCNHLYLFDAKTGKVKNQITRGAWMVRSVEKVDEENRQIWFRGLGMRPGQDPYYTHFARVNFDGSGLQILTDGDGTHDWQESPDGRYLIDRWSRTDSPPVTSLRDARSGALICELEKADASELLKSAWSMPERFAAKGRDGATDIYGIIVKPSNFDATKKYPVVEQIYAGPHDFFVPKSFSTLNNLHKLAELGFIVVQIDGMGTNWRGTKFHDVSWKNLKDAGFPDRIAWLREAAKTRPWMDLSRVGIYGGSAGGQNALAALLWYGDFYKAAAADCGCHDNRMDKIWWNEAWMGWPVGPEYAENSNVANAKKLQGKLLLTVGELDTNVDPASTMQVVNALIKADKDFDLLIIPGANHGAGESPYGQRRRMDFFVKNLLGVEPRGK